MRRVTTIAELRAEVAAARRSGATVGFLPTLGGLHEGHLAGVRLAAAHAQVVVVSVFVNPTQFDRADDLAAYPRDLEADEALLAGLGTTAPALLFAPSVEEMYPGEPLTTVHVAGLTEVLEGASRPGHFDGVATVVTKLLSIVQPDVAAFGRKDFQQLKVVRRLVADLDLPVEILEIPTVRDHDGLALSSRNARLTRAQRTAALALPRSLVAGVRTARQSRHAGRTVDPDAIERAVLATLGAQPQLEVDQVAVVEPDTLRRPSDGDVREHADGAPARLLVAVAAHLGDVRLIDNVEVGHLDDEERLLTAVAPA